MGGLKQFTQQIQQFWARQSTFGRVAYGSTTVLLMALVGGVGYWASRTEYAVLFSGLPAEDADAIVQKLDADRTAYQLAADGTTILVPSDKVHKARMTLVATGLPQGSGKGFELFDQMSMGTTPFVQNMNYVRAIQGELARTIMTLEPVAHARVHIVQPEPTPFVREEKPVTASVVIKTRAGAALSRRATAGIVALVAGSVKGLTAENVTVLDSDGQVLSERRDPKGGTASSDQLAYQRDVESHLASKAQEILSRLLGHGRAVVRVTADMSFRHLKETSEKFDPDGKVITRESLTSSKTTSTSGTRGPAGAVSNIPPGQNPGQSGAGPNKNDETIENEYVVSKVNRQLEEQQGMIDRLTVAVMLIPSPTNADTPPEETLGITPAEAKELVKQAVGYKEGRDQIQVSIGKVAEAPADAAVDAGILALQQWQNYAAIVRASSLGAAAFVLLAIGLVAMRRRPVPGPAMTGSALSSGGVSVGNDELTDLQAVAATVKAWLEEPTTIRLERDATGSRAKPA